MLSSPILIVEDDPDASSLVSHIIHHLKMSYETAADAEIALNKLYTQGNRYVAVIIDIALPGKDGWELVKHIRENPATESLICIAVTAYHTSKTREQAVLSGFNAYFPKPIDATHFARELSNLLAPR
jgi:CheY-like chemotaxis protein